MKKATHRILLVELSLFVISLILFFIGKRISFFDYSVFLLISLSLATLLLGWKRRREVGSKDVIITICIFVLGYYLFTYIFGFFTGFLRTSYSHSFPGILKNVLSHILFISLMECVREVLVKKCFYQKKVYLILLVVVLSFFQFTTFYTIASIGSRKELLECFVKFLILLSQNFLMTYIVYRSSLFHSILYRVLMEIPVFFLPIVPNMGAYLEVALSFVFPFLVYFDLRDETFSLKKKKKKEEKRIEVWREKYNILGSVVIVLLLVICISMVSGVFRYFALVIGSDSMKDTIACGDVIVLDQKDDNYELGDIIAYRYDSKIIVHRITMIDGSTYVTKGDNNNSQDFWNVREDEIIGKYKFRIRFIGWPTVILNQWIMDGE